MIIDCHGHYTTAPASHDAFRKQQIAHYNDPSLPVPGAQRHEEMPTARRLR